MPLHLIFLHSIGFSQRALAKIFADTQDYAGFYERLNMSVLKNLGLRDEKIQNILEQKSKLDETKIEAVIERLGVRIVTIHDSEYPTYLRETKIFPYFLYVRGGLLPKPLISIVGSRKSTPYSRHALEGIVRDLVTADYGIVSGGAYGVDALAHELALANSGYTISIFGTGIDRCYPAKHRDLFERILAGGGTLVSAFPLGMWPEAYNFPIRNEIVAGMSRGVLVTEAGEKSGTLITAGLALDFGRDVFAIPGDITRETSAGSNALIRDGQAKLVTSAADILSEYAPVEVSTSTSVSKTTTHEFADEIESSIYSLLQSSPLDASAIAESLSLDISTLAYRLSMMEVKGMIEMGIGGGYEVR